MVQAQGLLKKKSEILHIVSNYKTAKMQTNIKVNGFIYVQLYHSPSQRLTQPSQAKALGTNSHLPTSSALCKETTSKEKSPFNKC